MGDPETSPSLSRRAVDAARLGIFGGSFDPPHAGHLYLAAEARASFELDHVLFVPAARPPHKLERRLASGKDRCAMLEILLDGRSEFSIWNGELARSGPSYALDTVHELMRARTGKGGELFLLIGADNLEGFARWHGVEELVCLTQPVVCVRSGSCFEPESLALLSDSARAKLRAGRLEVTPFEASSSKLRRALRAGRDPGPGLPSKLLEYLRSRDIY
ncbi:MAG: nicotinate (nicotinamide) nucleotide adenylyltransferase [Planctomycetes bacterium]|nr:nicotinate (nicotinamide) nucleotide adenylyltransferase [Planctomycetota bacterium]